MKTTSISSHWCISLRKSNHMKNLFINRRSQCAINLILNIQHNIVNIDVLSGDSITKTSDAKEKFQKMFQDKESCNIFIFTDDSKTEVDSNNHRTGMASWSSNKKEYKLFDLTSSFSAVALLTIVKKIVSSELDNFIIFSDCKSVLNVRKIKGFTEI